MAITHSRSRTTGYSDIPFTLDAPTPSGSGGVLVVMSVARGNGGTPATPTPTTAGDWTAIADGSVGSTLTAAWATDVASPDMTWDLGAGELTLVTYRVDDGTMTGVVSSVGSIVFDPAPQDMGADAVGVTDPSARLVIVGNQNEANITGSSQGLSLDYVGRVDPDGFWAKSMAAFSVDGATGGETGTLAYDGDGFFYIINVFVPTTGGGGGFDGSHVTLSNSTRVSIIGPGDGKLSLHRADGTQLS